VCTQIRIGGGKGAYFKSKIIKKTLNPEWKESFNVTVQKAPFRLLIKVFDWDRIGKHDSLYVFLPIF